MTQPWSKLTTATGNAQALPDIVRSMCAADPRQVLLSFSQLVELLMRPHTWFPASAPAVELLLAAVDKAHDPVPLLVGAVEICGADQLHAWLAAPDAERGPHAELCQAVARHTGTVTALLAKRSAHARAAALALIATLPAAFETPRDTAEAAFGDDDEVVRVAALLALARLAPEEGLKAHLAAAAEDPAPALRGAAALCRLRRNARVTFRDSRDGIASWLGWEPQEASTGPRFAWFGLAMNGRYTTLPDVDGVVRPLVALAAQRDATRELEDLMCDLGPEEQDVAARRAGATVLQVGSFFEHRGPNPAWPHVATVAELQDEQQRIAERLAELPMIALAGHGLPAAGRSRRRWLGLEKGGILEREVEIQLGGETERLPLWRAWTALYHARQFGRPMPTALAASLESGFERWLAIVEFGAAPYGGPTYGLRDEEVEAILDDVEPDAPIVAAATELADAFADTDAVAAREGTGSRLNPSARLLLFLPMTRAEHPIEPRWYPLLNVAPQPLAREVLESLSPDARARVVLERVAKIEPMSFRSVPFMLDLLEIGPSPEVARRVEACLSDPDILAQARGKDGAMRERLERLAKQHAAIRSGLDGP